MEEGKRRNAEDDAGDGLHERWTLIGCEDLRLRRLAGIGQEIYDGRADHLAHGVDDEKEPRTEGRGRKEAGEQCPQEEIVQNEAKDTVCAYMGIFHYGQDALSRCASAKSVAEVGKTILMKRAREEHSAYEGEENSHSHRQMKAEGHIADERHEATRHPSSQGPQGYHMTIARGIDSAQAPEGQTSEEGQCGKYAH